MKRTVRTVGRELIPRTTAELAILVSLNISCVVPSYVVLIYLASFHTFFFHDGYPGSPADEYYLNDASMKELLRLRKDALVRLYTCAGLSDDFDALTKHDLVDAIISARDDLVDLPPSSPSGCTSSDGSSDDGHFGGGEETDVNHRFRPAATNGLRRRVTVHNIVAQPARTEREGRSLWDNWTRNNLIRSSIPPSPSTATSASGELTRTRHI
jgi:hypothetical protein